MTPSASPGYSHTSRMLIRKTQVLELVTVLPYSKPHPDTSRGLGLDTFIA